MGFFSGFQIFNDIGQYVNSEKMGAINGALGNLQSISRASPDQLFGALGNQLTRFTGVRFGYRNLGYIVDTVTGGRVAFQYTVPAKETGGADFNVQHTIGRSTPHFHYKGGKERTLEMPITFTMTDESREDVKRQIRFLESLAYPDYTGSDEISLAPHPIVVIQGRLYTKDLWLVKDFAIQWGEARDPYTQLPSEATINLVLTEVVQRGKSQSEVIRL